MNVRINFNSNLIRAGFLPFYIYNQEVLASLLKMNNKWVKPLIEILVG